MIRIVTLAATAALLAAPAGAQTIRVSTDGKSAEQLHAEVVKAARKVCARATQNATFPREEKEACMKASLAHAFAQPAAAKLAANAKLASR